MTERTIGYVNTRCGTDVYSEEIFYKDGALYIVDVRKRPGSVQPDFTVGGFCARCNNTDQVWAHGIVYREGQPREIEVRNGYCGFWSYCCKETVVSRHNLYQWQFKMNDHGYRVDVIEDQSNDDAVTVRYYKPTKNGSIRRKFNKIVAVDAIEPTCKFYYDYNF